MNNLFFPIFTHQAQ